MLKNVYIGCAGWSIPKEQAGQFAAAEKDAGHNNTATHLERYALRLPGVEINSSFYRSHRPATYARWAASVPEYFRFSVKLPRQITHLQKLHVPEELLVRFHAEVAALGDKLGPILVQLPPSLSFDEAVASAFFEALRVYFPSGSVVCEPRHASWFEPNAERVLHQFHVGRVAADPPVPVKDSARPGGWNGVVYYRLHGSPRTYYSAYGDAFLETLARTISSAAESSSPPEAVWCIFDNTALGAATANALTVAERIHGAAACRLL